MRLERSCLLSLALLVACFAGCGSDESEPLTPTGGGTGGSQPIPPTPPISAKATVKFKTKARLVNDLMQTLDLSSNQLCTELGEYSCEWVHSIALGGTDAYGAGIYQPLQDSAVTSPIAVERLVLSACQTRAYLDFQDPAQAKLFTVNVAGNALADVEDASVTGVIDQLFKRGHLRTPKEGEYAHLRQLYRDIEASGSAKPAQDWAAMSCFAVLTMMESVFY